MSIADSIVERFQGKGVNNEGLQEMMGGSPVTPGSSKKLADEQDDNSGTITKVVAGAALGLVLLYFVSKVN